jgi:gliding motility-associated-like protein
MLVAFEQINKGCPGECKSQVIATASEGFPPYRYLWYADVAPNDSSYALGLCSEDQYKLTVYDTICSFDTSYTVDAYHLPEIEVNIIPDTLYTTNPVASLNFDNKSSDSIQLTNWVWKFTDGTSTNDMNPSHVFPDSDTVTFIYTTTDGCTDSIKTNVEVKVFELEIPNVFTPNGDGTNETWAIPNLDRYIDNDLIVFNRWGQKVFNSGDYKGDWDGGKLPDGVYFYILRCYGYWKEDVFRGAVSIVGSRY